MFEYEEQKQASKKTYDAEVDARVAKKNAEEVESNYNKMLEHNKTCKPEDRYSVEELDKYRREDANSAWKEYEDCERKAEKARQEEKDLNDEIAKREELRNKFSSNKKNNNSI